MMKKKNNNEASVEKSQRTSLVLECSIEQKDIIQIMAAQENKSISDFILSLVEKRKSRKLLWNTPSK